MGHRQTELYASEPILERICVTFLVIFDTLLFLNVTKNEYR